MNLLKLPFMISFERHVYEHLCEKNLECSKFNFDIIDLGALKLNIWWEAALNQETLNEGSTVNSLMCNWVKE